jgi:hypothetical protein
MKTDKRDDQILLEAAREYLTQCHQYLANSAAGLPDASKLAKVRCSHSSILGARSGGTDELGLGIPFIAAKIKDLKAPGEVRHERYFDPWYYNTMLVAELSGGAFCFDRSKNGKYYFLAFVRKGVSKGRHYLRRSIANTPAYHDTRERQRTTDSHLVYCRSTLNWTAKKAIRMLGQLTRRKSRTREDMILFAVALFEVRIQNDRSARELGLSVKEYEVLLREAFRFADAIHSALHEELGSVKPTAEAAE